MSEEHRDLIQLITGREYGHSLDEILHCLYEEYLEITVYCAKCKQSVKEKNLSTSNKAVTN